MGTATIYTMQIKRPLQISPLVTKTAVVISNSAQQQKLIPKFRYHLVLHLEVLRLFLGECFISSKDSYEAVLLSKFRDDFLLKYDLGVSFVDAVIITHQNCRLYLKSIES